ncbi:Elongator subunit [Martiniozyma asiatica (nom. inval.)]|nr:Elongator subunit [Martiniozyma asiatica]
MKNLRILNRGDLPVSSTTYPDLLLQTAQFNLSTDAITLLLSSPDANIVEIQQLLKTGQTQTLSSIEITPGDEVFSLAHFSDSNECIIVLKNGDIIQSFYDAELLNQNDYWPQSGEIIGSFDCGIKCATWSLDEEVLVVVTNENNVVLLSRSFEPLGEFKMDSNDVNIDRQVSVGWGKEETQFKGKGAKQAERAKLAAEKEKADREALVNSGMNIDGENAILRDPTIKLAEMGHISPFDDGVWSISWRGDCQFFAINSVENNRRVIRVYSREGQLISCSEAVDGHEGTISWKPQGGLIASSQRRWEYEIDAEVVDIIFFEKNGLRHGEFDSRWSSVKGIDWSSNSEMLATWNENKVGIWCTKNYHWYLKQEITLPLGVKFVKFHPEKPMKLLIGGLSTLEVIDMSYVVTQGPTVLGKDLGMVLVADGNEVGITPFAVANVPPPINFRQLYVDEPVRDLAVGTNNSILAILTEENLYIGEYNDKLKQPTIVSKLLKNDIIADGQLRQVSLVNDYAYVLADFNNQSQIIEIELLDLNKPQVTTIDNIEPYKVISLQPDSDFNELTYQTVDGSVSNQSCEMTYFPQFCNMYAYSEEFALSFGLTSNGKLFMNDTLIQQSVTSFLLTDSYLLYTTSQQLKFIHLNSDLHKQTDFTTGDESNDERVRMIERGSLLITSIPHKSAVVLQAPRGNLETFYPRIMVLNDVRQAIKKHDYYSAFVTCRTHRIALDILHDYDVEGWEANVDLFIEQINKVDWLDLFLSCLVSEDVCQTKYRETAPTNDEINITGLQKLKLDESKKEKGIEKVRKICDLVSNALIGKPQYLQTVITAYACQTPPRSEEALQLIATFDSDSDREKSIQHLCFLLDVNMLYKQSLGIYDIPLALVVAQQSQMDPKEYLPFLQGLYEVSDLRRRVMVDTFLKRYTKALDSLTKIDKSEKENIDDEIVQFIIDHELYEHALKIYRYTFDKFEIILRLYADWLHDHSEFNDAALAYERLKLWDDALEDYINARMWREAIAVCLAHRMDKLKDSCESLVVGLNYIHKYTDSAYITHTYLNDVKEALRLYGKDYQFSTCFELLLNSGDNNNREELNRIIDSSIDEGFGTIAELIADCKNQIDSQMRRLNELRTKKEEDPYAFYGEEGDMADNVSIAPSETSTKESFFTRYTGKTAGTAKTGASRRTAKNKRREERKRARGKKGTIYEEEYLIRSVGRLIERLDTTEPESIRLIEALIKNGKFEQAIQIQKSFVEVRTLLKDNVVEIYKMDEKDRERVDDRGVVYYIDEIPVPVIKEYPIKKILNYY